MLKKLNWKLAIFSVCFVILFVYLGFWQIDRGYEKRELIRQDVIHRGESGIDIKALLNREVKDGQPVRLEGKFDEKIRLLRDNVVLNGRVGFELVVPFHTTAVGDVAATSFLINLGYLPMGRTRADLPSIAALPRHEVEIKGHVYLTKPNVMIQNGAEGDLDKMVIQSINPEDISLLTGEVYHLHLIRLDEQADMALPRYWPLVIMPPEKHFGYAFTWFLMAMTLMIAFATFTIKTNKETEKDD